MHTRVGATVAESDEEEAKRKMSNALFLWFEKKLGQDARLSGPFLKQKAIALACAQGSEFTLSDGWLSRWKARNNMGFKKEQGEKQDADLSLASDRKRGILPDILRSFSKEDIFNADETGIYFRSYPDKGHCARGSDLAGGKKANNCSLLC